MVLMFQIDFESIALAGVNDLIRDYSFDRVDGVDVFNFELISNWLIQLV